MSVKIIVDSTADVSAKIKDQLITVPLTLRFGDEEYTDGVTINKTEFYEKLIESDVMPSTSQANIDDFDKIFSEITDNRDTAVVLTLSSKLSGTYNSARIAAQDHPGRIFVVDTQSVSIGIGVLAETALELANDGCTAEYISDYLEEEKKRVKVIAMFDTLEYLRKGGRISKTAAIAGGLLSIKPVVTLKDGEITILGKARGSKQANNFLASEITASGGIDFGKPLLLGYTGLSDTTLHKYIEDSSHLYKDRIDSLEYTLIGSVVGTHAGPGAVAVAFWQNNAR